MPRPLALTTGPWSDRGLEEMAQKAAEWGYQGLDLACGGEHFAVQRALSEADYGQKLLETLEKHELRLVGLSNQAVGQAVCDRVDARHQRTLPDYVWGDGDSAGVQSRAAEEMAATARAAQKLGVGVVIGATGSPIWSYLFDVPPAPRALIDEGYKTFARQWTPILDAFRDASVRFALEVMPGQVAFDLYSAEQALKALDGREEFGFAFNPAHLHWQGVDPVEFLRAFPDRTFAVLVSDAAVTLNGRTGILGGHLRPGDPRRGWSFRAPGHGGVDWPGVMRTLNEVGYDGPLTVAVNDPGMDRDHAAADAAPFVRRVDIEPARGGYEGAFGEAG